jgi:hypothetical protein
VAFGGTRKHYKLHFDCSITSIRPCYFSDGFTSYVTSFPRGFNRAVNLGGLLGRHLHYVYGKAMVAMVATLWLPWWFDPIGSKLETFMA